MPLLLLIPALRARTAQGTAPVSAPVIGAAPARGRVRLTIRADSRADSVSRMALRLTSVVRADSASSATLALGERFGVTITDRSSAAALLAVTVPAWSLEEDAILAAALDLLTA